MLSTVSTDVNECQQNLAECHHLADCYNTDGSYLCVCQKGFYGDGFYCSRKFASKDVPVKQKESILLFSSFLYLEFPCLTVTSSD